MLEYRVPRPHPGPTWYSQRHSAIWERRRPDRGPAIPITEDQEVVRAPGAVITLSLHAHPATVSLELRVQLRRAGRLRASLDDIPAELPDDFLRVGVRFSDGLTATNFPGAFWMAPEDGPLFIGDAGGHFGGRDWRLHWTLWPLPPAGPIVVAVALPAYGIPESIALFDGGEIRAAAARSAAARWPDEPDVPIPEWLQRTETDPPIRWAVTAWLRSVSPRDKWDSVVHGIVAAAGVDAWDGADADAWAEEYQAARDAAPDPERFGYFALYRGAYRLEFTETAPTHATAVAQTKTRLNLPQTWTARIEAEPADG